MKGLFVLKNYLEINIYIEMKQHENGRLLPVKMDFRPDVENEGVRSMMMRLEDMYPDENIKFHQW